MIRVLLKSSIATKIGFLILPWIYTVAVLSLGLYIQPHHYAAILRVRGDRYAREGDTDKALEAYKSTLRLRLDHHFAWSSLGTLEEKLGNIKMAAYCFDRASTLRPTSVLYRYHLSRLLLKMEEYEAALFHVDHALDVASKPNERQVVLDLKAETLKAMGREREAQDILKAAEDSQ